SVGDGFWIRVRDFERSFYSGSKIESARFFKKQYVKDVGGFDENYVFFEESTLPQKLEKVGMSVNARISSYIMHHEENFNLRGWLRKKDTILKVHENMQSPTLSTLDYKLV